MHALRETLRPRGCVVCMWNYPPRCVTTRQVSIWQKRMPEERAQRVSAERQVGITSSSLSRTSVKVERLVGTAAPELVCIDCGGASAIVLVGARDTGLHHRSFCKRGEGHRSSAKKQHRLRGEEGRGAADPLCSPDHCSDAPDHCSDALETPHLGGGQTPSSGTSPRSRVICVVGIVFLRKSDSESLFAQASNHLLL